MRKLSGEKRKQIDRGKFEQARTSKHLSKKGQTSYAAKGKGKACITMDENSDNDFENPKFLKTKSGRYEVGRDKAKKKGNPLKVKNKEDKTLPIGGLDLSEIEPDSDSEALAAAWRKQYKKEKMRPTDVMSKILETSETDIMFKLNFLVLCVNSMAECSGMGACNVNFLRKLKNTDMIPRINWARYIYEHSKLIIHY
ncbi:hypothetical protein L6452_18765 [Arctium lappa]|uniref:Uncharacterized protein n=1 Tax=Arctium lappa TaxID=4217 RepID=A0ACB9C781_ARCLA|nr:hypothetical protein L6452_18765 [Arctium lappa]